MPVFEHEMLREIYEQPEALRNTLPPALCAGRDSEHRGLAAHCRLVQFIWEILIAASGSSRHSGLYGEILLEDLCGFAVDMWSTQVSTAVAEAQTRATQCVGAFTVRRDF